MMKSQLIFLLIISVGICFGLIDEKYRFERMLPIVCMSIILTLFIFGILNALRLGVAVILVLCGVLYFSFIVFCCWIAKKEGIRFLLVRLRRLITPGLLVFLAFYGFTAIMNYRRPVVDCDELSHWATVVKQMVVSDVLGTSPKATAVWFKSYPPAMALFQYFQQRITLMLSPELRFSEWRLYFSYQVLCFSFLLPFIGELDFKKPYAYFMTVFLWASPLLFFMDAYTCVCIDPFLGIVPGACTALIFTKREWNIPDALFVLLGISVLVLTKDSGLLFASFVLIAFLLRNFSVTGKVKQKIFSLLLGISSIVFPKILWEYSIASNNVAKSFGNSYDFSSLINVLTGREKSYRVDVIKNFCRRIFDKSAVTFFKGTVMHAFVLVFLLVLLYVLYLLNKKRNKGNLKFCRAVLWLIVIEMIVYTLGQCMTYMYKFSEYEAVRLASFTRYFGTMTNMVWIFILLSFTSALPVLPVNKNLIVMVLFCLMFATNQADAMSTYFFLGAIENAKLTRSLYDDYCRKIDENVPDKSKIYLISQETANYDMLMCKFLLLENEIGGTSSIGEPFYEGDIWTERKTAEEWKQELYDNYDYVALYKLNDYFYENYSELFSDPGDIEEQTLFAVNKNTGKLETVF